MIKLIFRYLAKEVFLALVSLTVILLLIFMSNQFVLYLNRAAKGQIPIVFVLKLMMLEMPNLLGLLLPLGFYIALILAYGRLYAEHEMTVLRACGYGPRTLLKHSLGMATVIAFIVTILSWWGAPYIALERAKLIQSSGIQMLIQTILPGRFTALGGGKEVFFIETMNHDRMIAQQIFLARYTLQKGQKKWEVLRADRATMKGTLQDNTAALVLENGRDYQGIPGQANYQIAQFKRLEVRLPPPERHTRPDARIASMASLWPLNNTDLRKAAELQWRLSIPIMVFVLTFLAVPLSVVNPRAGKFARLLPAVLLYIIYANFIFVSRNWIMFGKIPWWVGMWWLHGLMLSIAAWLFYRQERAIL